MGALKSLIASLAVVGWAGAAHAEPLAPEEAAKHVGETVTVCGQVVGAKYAAQVRGGPTFLDFGKPYPNTTFTALIFGGDRAKFGTPEKTAQGKRVCVTGKVQLYEGKPQIILTDPTQLSDK
jgi:DNA/RNA endonuclease YhcR with UshA esterase domain